MATIGLNINLNDHYFISQKENIELEPQFNREIHLIRVFPGMDPKPYLTLLENSSKAIILEGLGAGNLPALTDDWLDFINQLRSKDILVFMSSQSSHGKVDLHLYICGRKVSLLVQYR